MVCSKLEDQNKGLSIKSGKWEQTWIYQYRVNKASPFYFCDTKIREHPSIGEYWNISGIPVLLNTSSQHFFFLGLMDEHLIFWAVDTSVAGIHHDSMWYSRYQPLLSTTITVQKKRNGMKCFLYWGRNSYWGYPLLKGTKISASPSQYCENINLIQIFCVSLKKKIHMTLPEHRFQNLRPEGIKIFNETLLWLKLYCENINHIEIFLISWKKIFLRAKNLGIAWGYKVFQPAHGNLNLMGFCHQLPKSALSGTNYKLSPYAPGRRFI